MALAGDQQQESRKTVLLSKTFVAGPLASESAASTILILNDLSRPQQCRRRSYDNRYVSNTVLTLFRPGPALLCLYFAALGCTTPSHSPSVPLPRSKSSSTPMELSYENCPFPFISFLRVWANTVPTVQSQSKSDMCQAVKI